MKLVIVHYHLRPGGIRRVIEMATPAIIGGTSKIDRVIIATGEAGDARWIGHFANLLIPVPVEFLIEPAIGYLSEQKTTAGRVKAALENILRGASAADTLVWAHNLGVGRNLLLARELARICAARNLRLISHHHDWWFDNRWLRWPQMQRAGFPTLDSVARAVFPGSPNMRQVAINRADAAILKRHRPGSTGWLPNPAEPGHLPAPDRVRQARAWLRRELGNDAPVWILPCRLLRRKNMAEALLLTRWLRPEAWLVTTGGASSADEVVYGEKLAAAGKKHRWPVRWGILQGDETRKPGVAELMAASECVLLTSVQEGFGLPYLEAASARRPLIARELPNIAPDLEKFGFRFPQAYEEILVDPELFDWAAERVRQQKSFGAWQAQLPPACRRLAGTPVLLAQRRPQPAPFSRLTLTAQLEVLAHPADVSWERCAALNPFLKVWRRAASTGRLRATPWPRGADCWLSGAAYARQFWAVARGNSRKADDSPAVLQADFIREKLGAGQLFPLLWGRES